MGGNCNSLFGCLPEMSRFVRKNRVSFGRIVTPDGRIVNLDLTNTFSGNPGKSTKGYVEK